MKYPQKFIKKVQKEYLANKYLLINKDLLENQAILGQDLGSYFKIEPETLLQAIKTGNFKDIRRKAQKSVRRKKIYAEWEKIYAAELAR